MTLKATFSLTAIAAGIVASYLVVSFILANAWIIWALLALVSGVGGWIGYTWIQIFTEKRKTAQIERRKNSIIVHTDGYGMTHLIDIETGNSQNLTLDARAYRNGHFEVPHPIEQQNLQMILGSRFAGSAKEVMRQTQAQLPAPQELDLLPLLDKAERVLIKGASDAGKTTLLQHIASRSRGVLLIDPHNKPGQWPVKRIIGDGYDFTQIQEVIDWLPREIAKRYKMRGDGDESYSPITIIVDEFITIKEECENTKHIFSKAIRECRKIKIRLFVGSHSELLKPLGLEGAGDIRDGLVIVRLDVDQVTKQRSATVDFGRGERPCYIPPYSQAIEPDLVIASRTCLVCGGSVSEKQVYCSPACKQKAYRERVTP